MARTASATSIRGRAGSLRVGTKIVLAVAVVAVVAVLTAGVAWWRMGSLDNQVQSLKAQNITRLDALVSLQDGLSDMYRGLFLFTGAQNATDKKSYQEATKAGQAEV